MSSIDVKVVIYYKNIVKVFRTSLVDRIPLKGIS
jgi:hypothetical protein